MIIILKDRRLLMQAYLARHKAAGSKLLKYQTPCCGYSTTTVAAPADVGCETTCVCLGCGQYYRRLVASDSVTVSL